MATKRPTTKTVVAAKPTKPIKPTKSVTKPISKPVTKPVTKPVAKPTKATVKTGAKASKQLNTLAKSALVPKSSAKPVATKPAATKPVATKPVATQPAATTSPKPPAREARTVKISRPVAANKAVITRNARAPASAAVKPVVRFSERLSLVAETAYYLSESRGFLPGFDLVDWLAAEARVDARFTFV